MNFLQNKILEIVKQATEETDYLLIDVVFKGDERNRIIQLFVDSESGVSADDCASVSNQVSKILDQQDIIKSNYRLEVSSPGTERSLKYLQQYLKHINRKFEVVYTSGEEQIKVVGRLERIEEEDLFFTENNNELMINFNKIKSAKVLISF